MDEIRNPDSNCEGQKQCSLSELKELAAYLEEGTILDIEIDRKKQDE